MVLRDLAGGARWRVKRFEETNWSASDQSKEMAWGAAGAHTCCAKVPMASIGAQTRERAFLMVVRVSRRAYRARKYSRAKRGRRPSPQRSSTRTGRVLMPLATSH